MSDVALSSIYDLDRYTAALTLGHPSPDVQLQGEVIKKNMKQMLRNQQIIMEQLRQLEKAIKNEIVPNELDHDFFLTERSISAGNSSLGVAQASPVSHQMTTPSRRLERTPKLVRLERQYNVSDGFYEPGAGTK